MKNKGFTLVELLAVIVLLTLILILIIPKVANTINQSKDTVYQKQINAILNATYDWSLKNTNYLPEPNNKVFITLSQLKSFGLIDANIKDPTTKNLFPDNLVISIKNLNGNYKKNSRNSKQKGNYLYTVETEFMDNSEFSLKKPIIILEDLTENSEGNYVTVVNINDIFEEPQIVATSSDNEDLTSKVITTITLEDRLVKNVDTSLMGIYYINYTVIDKNGYSNTITQNVIVTDIEKPIINLPTNNNISLDVSSYDLMDGVSCEDNSGHCDISINGEVNFGTEGKYILEYVAKDPSGNTATQKRVITIE